jgi:hypothetical protein
MQRRSAVSQILLLAGPAYSQAIKDLTHNDYTVPWTCALPSKKTVARNMLDELYVPPPHPEHDKNIYVGRQSKHGAFPFTPFSATARAGRESLIIRSELVAASLTLVMLILLESGAGSHLWIVSGRLLPSFLCVTPISAK